MSAKHEVAAGIGALGSVVALSVTLGSVQSLESAEITRVAVRTSIYFVVAALLASVYWLVPLDPKKVRRSAVVIGRGLCLAACALVVGLLVLNVTSPVVFLEIIAMFFGVSYAGGRAAHRLRQR